MMNDYKFIKTQDKHTKETLLQLGFQLLSDDGRTATFINDSKLQFEIDRAEKISYSNILCV